LILKAGHFPSRYRAPALTSLPAIGQRTFPARHRLARSAFVPWHNALADPVAPPPAADILQMSNPANIIVRGATAIGKYSGSYGPCHQAAPNSRGRRVLCNMVRLGHRKPALQGRCILVRQDPSVRLHMLCDSREAFVNGGSGSVSVSS